MRVIVEKNLQSVSLRKQAKRSVPRPGSFHRYIVFCTLNRPSTLGINISEIKRDQIISLIWVIHTTIVCLMPSFGCVVTPGLQVSIICISKSPIFSKPQKSSTSGNFLSLKKRNASNDLVAISNV